MSENQREPASYQELLDKLETLHPELALALREAHVRRTQALSRLLNGGRLAGADALLRHLRRLEEAWTQDATLDRLAPLIDRLVRDFYTAVEAVLSGFAAVCTDALRDVMEIENLLRDFSADVAQVEAWLSHDPRKGPGVFGPGNVRKRIRDAGVGSSSALENADYAAHSIALHVNANSERAPLFRKGLIDDHSFEGDAGFWEIFEHARRVLGALDLARDRLASDPSRIPDGIAAGPIREAWERTQEMLAVYIALLEVSADGQASEGEWDVEGPAGDEDEDG